MTPADRVTVALARMPGATKSERVDALANHLTRSPSRVWAYLNGETVPRVVLAKLEALNE